MSKAIKRTKERYWLEPSNIETQEKYAAYIEGYHQAEKDLELSWEDIEAIDQIFTDVFKDGFDVITDSYYQEVLKRFKANKNVEQKV